MLSRVWMGGGGGQREGDDSQQPSWNRNTNVNVDGDGSGVDMSRDGGVHSLPNFKQLLEVENEWYLPNNSTIQNHSEMRDISFSPNLTDADNLLLQPIDSSSSCSPSPSVFNTLDPSHLQYLMPSKSTISSRLNVFSNNPVDHTTFDLDSSHGFFQETQAPLPNLMNNRGDALGGGGGGGGILSGFTEMTSHQSQQIASPNLNPNPPQFSTNHLIQHHHHHHQMPPPENGDSAFGGNSSRFQGLDEGFGNSSIFMNRSKLLKPLDNCTSIGSQPTLFQKRAALRKNLGNNNNNNSSGTRFNPVMIGTEGSRSRLELSEDDEMKRNINSGDGMDSLSNFDGSAFSYDSDEFTENTTKIGGGAANNSNANSSMSGGGGAGGGSADDPKGKKKGLPAKNLMAERRRRKKLNDRLYMLRSVVPKISKMDRASILGDAIEYLKELLQKINDLHNELESPPTSSSLTQTTNFYPLTPTLPNLSSRVKEELCPSSLPSPNNQPARVEVRLREGRAVNIHMFCTRRPGLLLSIMRAMDGLGLDIQQAVISCFNGFAMDIFRAEQCKEGQDVHPDQIKALLLESAGLHGSTILGNCEI